MQRTGKYNNIKETASHFKYLSHIIFLILLTTPFGFASARDGRFYLEAGTGYSRGGYGAENDLGMFYLSPKFGYSSPSFYVNLTVPYLFVSDDSDQQNGMMMNMSMDMGLGDIVISGGKLLLKNDGRLSLYGSLLVKLPTADEAGNLGSGETDYGGYLNLELPVNTINFSLRGGYLYIGDSDFQDNNDIYLYGIGVSKWLDQSKFILSLEKRRSLITGYGNPLELYLGYFRKINNDYSLNGNITFGLDEDNNDLGLYAGFTRWF